MHKLLQSALLVSSLALVLSGCSKGGSSGGGGGDLIATVNGDRISKDDYITYLEHKMQVMVQTSQGPATAPVAAPLGFQALNDLVGQKLLIQMAKQENVLPTENDVNNELQFQTSIRADFVRALTDQGFTLSDIKNDLMVGLCRHNLLSKGVTITDAQVDAYIKENPQRFETPRTVDLSWIVLKNPADKDKVDSDLRSGQTFTVVSKRYSAVANPMFAQREYNKFNPTLQKIVDKLKEGQSSDWITEGGSAIRFHVEKDTPASKVQIKDWMKTAVKRELADKKGSAAQDLDKKLLVLRKQAKVEVLKPGMKERFEQQSKQLKESDMNSATSSASKPNSTSAPAANNQ